MDRFWLTDEQFAKIAPHLPTDTRGKERVDDRRVISGIVQALRSGGRWADVPTEIYGPKKTLYNRFVRWAAKGVWVGLFETLAGAGGPPSQVLIDSSATKAHRCAAGGKRMARPVCKRFRLSDLSSLHQRIRSQGTPGQDGDPRVPSLIRGPASSAILRHRQTGHRLTVRPSRFHHPQTLYGSRRRVIVVSRSRSTRRRVRRQRTWFRCGAAPRRSGSTCSPARRLRCCHGTARAGREARCRLGTLFWPAMAAPPAHPG